MCLEAHKLVEQPEQQLAMCLVAHKLVVQPAQQLAICLVVHKLVVQPAQQFNHVFGGSQTRSTACTTV